MVGARRRAWTRGGKRKHGKKAPTFREVFDSHLDAWLAVGFSWQEFFRLTPYATARATNARAARVADNVTTGAYQAEAFTRTKRLKPLKAYLSKRPIRRDGGEQDRMLAALGITPAEIEEARQEAARLREDPKTLSASTVSAETTGTANT